MPTRILENGTALETRDEPSVDEILNRLRDERGQIEAAREADPVHRALDGADWHARDKERGQRIYEINEEIKRYENWGPLADAYSDAIHSFTAVVAPIKKKYARVVVNWRYDLAVGHAPNDDRVDFETWWLALSSLYRALPGDRYSRSVIEREERAWFLHRDAHWSARDAARGMSVLPTPEHFEHHQREERFQLPPWSGYGVYSLERGDR